jgi:putative acetyltransferase
LVLSVTVRVDDPASAEARQLIEQLDGYLSSLYPAESNHLLSVEALRQPGATFLTASVEGKVVGCGALIIHPEDGYAELKRMFVLPEFRGLGVGYRLLQEREARAMSAGLSIIRLETGVSQDEALRLYQRAGYQRRGPFGAYSEDPFSVFMEKRLE